MRGRRPWRPVLHHRHPHAGSLSHYRCGQVHPGILLGLHQLRHAEMHERGDLPQHPGRGPVLLQGQQPRRADEPHEAGHRERRFHNRLHHHVLHRDRAARRLHVLLPHKDQPARSNPRPGHHAHHRCAGHHLRAQGRQALGPEIGRHRRHEPERNRESRRNQNRQGIRPREGGVQALRQEQQVLLQALAQARLPLGQLDHSDGGSCQNHGLPCSPVLRNPGHQGQHDTGRAFCSDIVYQRACMADDGNRLAADGVCRSPCIPEKDHQDPGCKAPHQRRRETSGKAFRRPRVRPCHA